MATQQPMRGLVTRVVNIGHVRLWLFFTEVSYRRIVVELYAKESVQIWTTLVDCDWCSTNSEDCLCWKALPSIAGRTFRYSTMAMFIIADFAREKKLQRDGDGD